MEAEFFAVAAAAAAIRFSLLHTKIGKVFTKIYDWRFLLPYVQHTHTLTYL